MFPNLENEKIISLDIETHDTSIAAGLGSGARRDGCYVLGVGVSTVDRQFYFPVAHTPYRSDDLVTNDERCENIHLPALIEWLHSLPCQVIGANILYDLDYLQYQGYIPKQSHDIQFAEPLLNEEKKSYSLDSLARDYLGETKQSHEIENWCKSRGLKGKAQTHLAKMPVSLVGKYCKEDCRQTYEIFAKQVPRLRGESLMRVYDLERSLIPVLLKMKRTGVRIDMKKMEVLEGKYKKLEIEIVKRIKEDYKIELNENGVITNEEIEKAYRKAGLPVLKTEKGNASFSKYELLKHAGEMGKAIVEHRHIKKMQSTYIYGLAEHMIGDRAHPEFNPLRATTDYNDYGTRIGRFSGTNPNLQQIPKNDDPDADTGELIRSFFIPEDGCEWVKLDYSQMEMLLGIHFATGRGSDEIRARVIQNPGMDLYALIASIFYSRKIEKGTKERDIFKTQSLGKLYNMSAEKLGRNMGIITLPEKKSVVRGYWDKVFNSKKSTWEKKLEEGWSAVDMDDYPYLEQYLEAWRIANKIDKEFPWMKETSKAAEEACRKNGFVRTILGRKRRLSPDASYKAFQAIDSGTGADIMKSAMVRAFEDGIFDVLPCHLTVHDELDVSVAPTNPAREALNELKHIMETIIPLRVPMRVDVKIGKNWEECK
jgi:DNA polymerase-1